MNASASASGKPCLPAASATEASTKTSPVEALAIKRAARFTASPTTAYSCRPIAASREDSGECTGAGAASLTSSTGGEASSGFAATEAPRAKALTAAAKREARWLCEFSGERSAASGPWRRAAPLEARRLEGNNSSCAAAHPAFKGAPGAPLDARLRITVASSAASSVVAPTGPQKQSPTVTPNFVIFATAGTLAWNLRTTNSADTAGSSSCSSGANLRRLFGRPQQTTAMKPLSSKTNWRRTAPWCAHAS
mmetsp:Transcript_2221/g.6705  ORF Transcript_2221/g.6705 Transcript_2221/m.6705 type:complete len:251 (-) Transcript_2221:189-941(-)